VRLGDHQFGGEIALAGLVESLAAGDRVRHKILIPFGFDALHCVSLPGDYLPARE
jgi:hypothetical protein